MIVYVVLIQKFVTIQLLSQREMLRLECHLITVTLFNLLVSLESYELFFVVQSIITQVDRNAPPVRNVRALTS